MGPLTISAAPGPIRDALTGRLGLVATQTEADVLVCQGTPAGSAHFVILTGELTDEVDDWDESVPPQTIAGGLWIVTGQADPADAAVAWLILRSQTPTTPLSDLTDNNERALRWSVAAAITLTFPPTAEVEVDPAEVKAWTDAQPQVQDLGDAVARVGGETADAVLGSVQRLRAAMTALEPLGATAAATEVLDSAVAEHLRQVQRTGFGKWRAAKARAASLAALQQAARDAAGSRLREVLTARTEALRAQASQQRDEAAVAAVRSQVESATAALELPAAPDFSKVPRSWAQSAPQPRRYVFVHEDDLAMFDDFPVAVRPAPLPAGQALAMVVQSGFSLPALR